MEEPIINKRKKRDHSHLNLELLEEKWERQFYELKKFKKKYGHCDVPLGRKNPYYLLGMWCNHQRHNKKFQPLKYNPDREQKLNEIGFSWGILDKMFENKLRELKQFKKKYGHCNVSASERTKPYFSLSCWVRTQRMLYDRKILKADRIAKLNSIRFEWINPINDTWEIQFNELKEFKKKYGHCDVPERNKTYRVLSNWCGYQRKRAHNYPDRMTKLNKIGFTWNMLDKYFDDNFGKLKQYKEKNGHCRVKESENLSLSKWCTKLRRQRKAGKLSKEKTKRLTELGFIWHNITKETHELEWDHQFIRLKEHKKKFGHYDVSSSPRNNPYHSLSVWVAKQRKYYNSKDKLLMVERITKLNNIGFNWVRYITNRIDDVDLINELKRLYKLFGKPPNYLHIEKYGKYTRKAYYNHFGSIPKALEAAGIPPMMHKTLWKNQ